MPQHELQQVVLLRNRLWKHFAFLLRVLCKFAVVAERAGGFVCTGCIDEIEDIDMDIFEKLARG